jgi:mevalonate kinase
MAKNGQQLGMENLETFTRWVQERNAANDWSKYIYRGKISRTEIAKECNFAVSVTRQNRHVRDHIEELEIDLEKRGVLIHDRLPAETKAAERREDTFSQSDNRKFLKLEEQNAQLLVENECLKEKLNHYNLFDEYLMETGRLGKL